jgi:hypothetical protein
MMNLPNLSSQYLGEQTCRVTHECGVLRKHFIEQLVFNRVLNLKLLSFDLKMETKNNGIYGERT